MNRLFLLLIGLLNVLSLFGQPLDYHVLLRLEVNRPFILYSDPVSYQIDTVIFFQEPMKEDPPVFFVHKTYPCHFYGKLIITDQELGIVVREGYAEKTACYGRVIADHYISNNNGKFIPCVNIYSEPENEASYRTIEYFYNEIEGVPLDFIERKGAIYTKVLFMFNGELIEGYTRMFCTQYFTTCN